MSRTAAAPIRVGILDDLSDGPPSVTDIGYWLRLAVDDVVGSGRIDREVEFVHGFGRGLPSGTAAAVERAFGRLVDDEDVLLVVGPAIGDSALVVTPLVEARRVPAINWAGTEKARGAYMFHLQVGSHEDEALVLARYLADVGVRRVGVVHDRSPMGHRYVRFLRDEADILGLGLGLSASVGPLAVDAADEVARVLDAGADALVYLGLGESAPAVATAATEAGFTGPRAMNTAGLRGYRPDFAKAVDGWVYVDMHADENTTLLALRARLDLPTERAYGAAKGHDLGRLVAEGLARAPELTRAGVRAGLEQVKWLPAAEGHEGTLLGFGHHDRGALHGRYLVLRRWDGGRSVQVGQPAGVR
ncbi:ABC transporter substrate-binding protein [Yinghuangia sp. ASG 101]|uniref:ABC transporter substrate-binding protein n=1 Tax=Yinghuangia sp. ASG 101 TaxID=2896848 RepID=UPI001E58FE2F|nr:ABC transporter substrate-binding protein [Yinghuangia sp. ASG 101]UGQ11866.1 ABC transporter substrate-binding protein [Yinghuangia sp. ASG 101]